MLIDENVVRIYIVKCYPWLASNISNRERVRELSTVKDPSQVKKKEEMIEVGSCYILIKIILFIRKMWLIYLPRLITI